MKFRVLGALEVEGEHGAVAIRGARRPVLLATLILNANQIVPIDRLVDEVWPHDPPSSAVENIRTYLSELRGMLDAAGDRPRLESHPGAYRFQADREETDVLRFQALATAGRQALGRHDVRTAVRLLSEALALWRGPALAGLELGPSSRAKAVALEEQRWLTRSDVVRARLALGEAGELVPALRELIAERPLDESLWRYLATALHASGRTGEALAVCTDARETFVEELGVEPGPELQQVQAAILKGERGAAAVPVLVGGAPGASAPCQLPPAVPDFVGRREELRKVRRIAAEAADEPTRVRAVALSGAPGIGKTTTALAAAAETRDSFPDGQLYVDLRGSTRDALDARAAVGALLGGFGLDPASLPDDLDARVSIYRSMLADRRLLVVLDDVCDASQVAALFPGPGPSMVVFTSRRMLTDAVADARMGLAPLTVAEAITMLGAIVGPERIDDEPDASLAIAEACDRLPLAVRIAGMRLAARPKHPIRVLAERLDESDHVLDELSVDGMSVRARFDDSYRELGVKERRCFETLGVMDAGSVTAIDVGELMEMPTNAADRQLENLVQQGLLVATTTPDGGAAYRLPTLLHAYAREHVDLEAARLEEAAA